MDGAERREGIFDFPPRSPLSASPLVADRGRANLFDAAHQELSDRRQSQRRVEWFFLDGPRSPKRLPDFDTEGRHFACLARNLQDRRWFFEACANAVQRDGQLRVASLRLSRCL